MNFAFYSLHRHNLLSPPLGPSQGGGRGGGREDPPGGACVFPGSREPAAGGRGVHAVGGQGEKSCVGSTGAARSGDHR